MSSEKVNIESCPADVMKTLDFIICIDHSGSTSEPSTRIAGKTRFDEMQEQCLMMARGSEAYDDDGITVIPFASSARVIDNVTANKVKDVFTEFRPGGGTNLALALNEAVKHAKLSKKETVVFVFTDGEANDPKAVIDILNDAGKAPLGRPRIGFCFIQVGGSPDAAAFLDKLDNDLKVDVVATFSEEQAENLSLEQMTQAARTQ